ncbi:MAG: FecR domain-containing protein [Candidatus Baltobacteraceae bacterium]
MFHFRSKAPFAAACIAALLLPVAASGAADKQLQHQKGAVTYLDSAGKSHPVSGQVVLSDDSTAITGRSSLALLAMPDSSEISLGESTRIKVGLFNDAKAGPGNLITVNGGALKFAVRHPSGAKSNYQFVTPTSQIAVRGTEGYLVVGERGTQLVCTKCEPGDVTITVGGVIAAIVTGQVFTVLGPAGATTTSAGTVASFNNPAVNQFSNGANPFGNAAASSDVTGSASGASAAGASAGVSAGAIAGGAAVAGAAVAAVAAQTAPSAAPPSPPGPTSAPITIGPSSIVLAKPGDQQYLPVSGASSVFSQNPSIATASASGNMLVVRAAGSGTTVLTLSGPGWTRTISVTVMAAPVQH